MSRIRSSLRFRVRYEGRVQDIDRRPAEENPPARGIIHYIVGRTLSPFRAKWHAPKTGPKS